ncbi:unnamed protein product [Coffea canephora]|uniref:Uncharacterized protein n=1 Tax=Coffea canephora TaxID=49390 RepID=A0A068TMG3_COFCA|nr:unnamed protein product [Coffea canephora]
MALKLNFPTARASSSKDIDGKFWNHIFPNSSSDKGKENEQHSF